MDRILLKLLRLFHDHVPDRKSNVAVTKLISNESRWIEAHDMFSEVRDRVLRATGDAGRPKVPAHLIDHALVSQYLFEEICLKAIYNESDATCSDIRREKDLPYPFDSCSPFWVAGNALDLARRLNLPPEKVTDILAPPDRF